DIDSWLGERGFAKEDIALLEHGGFDALIQKRINEKQQFADPGYLEDGEKRYPIDTEAQIRAAWKNIHQQRNQDKYTEEQFNRVEQRIIAAWKRVIDPEGPPEESVERSAKGWPFHNLNDVDEETQ